MNCPAVEGTPTCVNPSPPNGWISNIMSLGPIGGSGNQVQYEVVWTEDTQIPVGQTAYSVVVVELGANPPPPPMILMPVSIFLYVSPPSPSSSPPPPPSSPP